MMSIADHIVPVNADVDGGSMSGKKLAVTICEAAAMISVSELTLRRKIWAGEVRAERVGGKLLVSVDEVRRLVGLPRKPLGRPRSTEAAKQ
jgi:excisionase family DNA binding protein